MNNNDNAGSVLLSRVEYDALLPMASKALAVLKRSKRKWSIEGVRITFASSDDDAAFSSWMKACHQPLRHEPC